MVSSANCVDNNGHQQYWSSIHMEVMGQLNSPFTHLHNYTRHLVFLLRSTTSDHSFHCCLTQESNYHFGLHINPLIHKHITSQIYLPTCIQQFSYDCENDVMAHPAVYGREFHRHQGTLQHSTVHFLLIWKLLYNEMQQSICLYVYCVHIILMQ